MTLSTPAPAANTGGRTEGPSGPPRRSGHAASALAATRRRLVAINLVVVTAILTVMAVAVYVAEAHAIDQQLNQQLTDRARHDSFDDALALVTAPPGVSAASEPRDAGDAVEHYEPSSPNVFSLVFDKSGRLILDPGQVTTQLPPDQSAVRAELAGTTAATFTSSDRGGHAFRLYTVPLRSGGTTVGALQVGTSLDARERQLRDLLLTLGLVGAGALVLTSGASLFLADRALVPARLAFERQRQFAAAASHELRTPLAIARSQADLVVRRLRRGDSFDTASVAGDVAEIGVEIDYMTRLVRELLLLARDAHGEHDRLSVAWRDVDLSLIAASVTAKMHDLALQRGLTLTAEIEQAPLTVRGDTDQLRQCVLVLVENAITYTPSGGSIDVGVRATIGPRLLAGHARCIELRVRDTGVGVTAEDAVHIFEPFYRGSAARRVAGGTMNGRDAVESRDSTEGMEGRDVNEGHRGAGLGLALAQWIVTAHDGTISVEPGPDGGSIFIVSLPAASAE
jgi:signal transduction histidine kinase